MPLTFEDREVQYPCRIKLVPVSGTSDQFDVELVPGTVTKAGTELNKATLEAIVKHAYIGLDRYIPVTASNNVLNVEVDGFIEQAGERIALDVSGITSGTVYLNINNGSNKVTNLTTNGRVELVYNGTSWEINSVHKLKITESGTYTLIPYRPYLAIVVGAGGGGARKSTSSYHYGGGGAVNMGIFIPTSASVSVTVGEGGKGVYMTNSASGSRTGDTGGYSQIGNIIAYGGSGGKVAYDSAQAENGQGGTYTNNVYSEEILNEETQLAHYGGAGNGGSTASAAQKGVGFTDEDGTTYGFGGTGSTSSSDVYADNGVVILYAL